MDEPKMKDLEAMDIRELQLFTARSVKSLLVSLTSFQRDYHEFKTAQLQINEAVKTDIEQLKGDVADLKRFRHTVEDKCPDCPELKAVAVK